MYDLDKKDKEKNESQATKKMLYKEYLRKQMEEDDYRKKVSQMQMTEQERKLNNRDLEAYANKVYSINSKVVGFRSNPIGPQQKYIAQKYGFKGTEYSPSNGGVHNSLEMGAYMALEDPINVQGGHIKRGSMPNSKGMIEDKPQQ